MPAQVLGDASPIPWPYVLPLCCRAVRPSHPCAHHPTPWALHGPWGHAHVWHKNIAPWDTCQQMARPIE